MIQAIGNARSSVRKVAMTDITAVRTNTRQYSGSRKNVLYWARPATYWRGPTRSRNESTARSMCGNTIRAPSQSTAGASSNPSPSRPCHRAGSAAALAILTRRPGAGRKADGALGIEAEQHLLLRPQVGELTGLRQGDAKFAPGTQLLEQHRRIVAVEQQALHLALVPGMACGQVRGGASEA